MKIPERTHCVPGAAAALLLILAFAGTTAKYASVAGGSDGSIQVVYTDPSDDMIYAVKRAGSWSVTDTSLITSSIFGPFLALDSMNEPGIILD